MQTKEQLNDTVKNKKQRILYFGEDNSNTVHVLIVSFKEEKVAHGLGDSLIKAKNGIKMSHRKGVSTSDIQSLRTGKGTQVGNTPDTFKRFGLVCEVDYDELSPFDILTSKPKLDKLFGFVKSKVEKEKQVDDLKNKAELANVLSNGIGGLRRSKPNPLDIVRVQKKVYQFNGVDYDSEKAMNLAIDVFVKQNSYIGEKENFVVNKQEYSTLSQATNAKNKLVEAVRDTNSCYIGRLSHPVLDGKNLTYTEFDLVGIKEGDSVHVFYEYEKSIGRAVRGSDGVVVGVGFIPSEAFVLISYKGEKRFIHALDNFDFRDAEYI